MFSASVLAVLKYFPAVFKKLENALWNRGLTLNHKIYPAASLLAIVGILQDQNL